MSLRRSLDALYGAAGWLAAAFLVGPLVMVLVGNAGRFLHFYLPGTDPYAGYCMAAAGFLALAHTLKRGDHIRVTLTPRAPRHAVATEDGAVGARGGHPARRAVRLVQRAARVAVVDNPRHLHGEHATPLWLPQISMALGTLVLLVALVDELVLEAKGLRRPHAHDKPAFNE